MFVDCPHCGETIQFFCDYVAYKPGEWRSEDCNHCGEGFSFTYNVTTSTEILETVEKRR